MGKFVAFKKVRTRKGIERRFISTATSPTAKKFISDQKRAGQFGSGNFVAFRIVKNKKAFKIQGFKVAKKGTPFRN